MAALRRGIARYQGGTEDVPPLPSMPVVPLQHPLNPRVLIPAPAPMPAAVAAATAPPAPLPASSGFSQLMHGQFAAAQQNPESSPAVAWIAKTYSDADTAIRANQAARGPSAIEWLGHIFGGKQSDTSMADRVVASQKLQDPLAQQKLISDPAALAAAEANPVAYSKSPEFQKYMDAHKELLANGGNAVHDPGDGGPPIKVPVTNPVSVANMAATAGVTTGQANAALNPGQHSPEEFTRIFTGMPTKTLLAILGPQLASVANPQQVATRKYLGSLDAAYREAREAREKLELDPKNLQASFWGESEYDKAKKLEAQRWQERMTGLGAIARGVQMPYPTQ